MMASVPTDVNLTDAAAMVIMAETLDGTAKDAALAVWQALTGLGDREEALDYARELLARGRDTIAALPPF